MPKLGHLVPGDIKMLTWACEVFPGDMEEGRGPGVRIVSYSAQEAAARVGAHSWLDAARTFNTASRASPPRPEIKAVHILCQSVCLCII